MRHVVAPALRKVRPSSTTTRARAACSLVHVLAPVPRGAESDDCALWAGVLNRILPTVERQSCSEIPSRNLTRVIGPPRTEARRAWRIATFGPWMGYSSRGEPSLPETTPRRCRKHRSSRRNQSPKPWPGIDHCFLRPPIRGRFFAVRPSGSGDVGESSALAQLVLELRVGDDGIDAEPGGGARPKTAKVVRDEVAARQLQRARVLRFLPTVTDAERPLIGAEPRATAGSRGLQS